MVKQLVHERRKGIRAKRILSIQHRLAKGKTKNSSRNWHLSTTHDMSILGLSFLSDTAYAKGDKLELRVVMSGILDIYNGLAEVIRVQRKKNAAFYLIGVKFVRKPSKPRRAKSYSGASKNRIYKRARK